MTRDRLLNCPEFYPGEMVNREYEERLYDYYGRPGYWEDRITKSKVANEFVGQK